MHTDAAKAEPGSGSTPEWQVPPWFSDLRVLIAHDWIVTWAGSERCVEQILSLFPQADVVVSILKSEMRGYNAVTRRARETWLGRLPGARAHHRWFVGLEALAFATSDTTRYDLVISSSHALAKAVRRRESGFHLCYCYSPPRYLWDLRERYLAGASRLESLALRAGTGALRYIDRHSAAGVDHFVGISKCVAERIERAYGRAADVVYPPVAPRLRAATGPCPRSDYLLYLGRLVPYKRVDLAVLAAERLRMRLVVAGDGPERARLERLAGAHTEFLGFVSEDTAGELMSRCAAFVFPAEEDFGIAPVEANAHGAPVVYFDRGGLAETMLPWVTGVPFQDESVDALASAAEACLGHRWNADDLKANAMRFEPNEFRQRFAAVVAARLGRGGLALGARGAASDESATPSGLGAL